MIGIDPGLFPEYYRTWGEGPREGVSRGGDGRGTWTTRQMGDLSDRSG